MKAADVGWTALLMPTVLPKCLVLYGYSSHAQETVTHSQLQTNALRCDIKGECMALAGHTGVVLRTMRCSTAVPTCTRVLAAHTTRAPYRYGQRSLLCTAVVSPGTLTTQLTTVAACMPTCYPIGDARCYLRSTHLNSFLHSGGVAN